MLVRARMLRWSLSTALIALLVTGCDVPLDGLHDPPQVDADGSIDATEPDAYSPPSMVPVDSGTVSTPDAGRAVFKDGSGDGHEAHPIDASAPDSGSQADTGGEGSEDDGS